MRNFSETDKKLIDLIVKISTYGFTFPDLIKYFIPNDCYIKIFEDSPETNTTEFKRFRLMIGAPKGERDKIFSTLFNLNTSIDFLITENYIISISDYQFTSIEINPQIQASYQVGWVSNDQIRYNLFTKFYHKFQVTDSLRELKKHNFSTSSEIINKRSNQISLGALFISALFAGYTMVNSNDFKKQADNNEIEIKGLKNLIESLNNKKDTIVLSTPKELSN